MFIHEFPRYHNSLVHWNICSVIFHTDVVLKIPQNQVYSWWCNIVKVTDGFFNP